MSSVSNGQMVTKFEDVEVRHTFIDGLKKINVFFCAKKIPDWEVIFFCCLREVIYMFAVQGR